MKNFYKLILGILATICCNNNIAVAKRFDDHSHVINENTNNNFTVITIDQLISIAQNAILAPQLDVNAHEYIGAAIQAFDPNDKYSNNVKSLYPNENVISEIVNDKIKMNKNIYIEMLSNININISGENQNNIITVIDELYNTHFRNDLEQNNYRILDFSTVITNSQKEQMSKNLQVIKSMSNINKHNLKNYLIINDIELIGLLNTHVSQLQVLKNYLNQFNTIVNNNHLVVFINNQILEIIDNVLEYLNIEKECLKELGIDPTILE